MPVMVFATLRSSSTARAERRSRARTHAPSDRQTAAAAAAGAAQHERERERRAQHVIPVDVKFCTLVLLHKPLCVSFMGDSSLEILKKKYFFKIC